VLLANIVKEEVNEMNNTLQVISDLDTKHVTYQDLTKRHEELFQEQEERLNKLMEDTEDCVGWYLKNSYRFTHPNLSYITSKGPILGYDEKESVLIVWILGKGIKKLDHNNEEVRTTNLYWLVRDGHFEDAVSGLLYLQKMLDKYSRDLTLSINKMEKELSESHTTN
jgi:hypothetical protein